ncbi:MAG: radical SAM protein, partial [Candidatus Thorarchaeota archaeon]
GRGRRQAQGSLCCARDRSIVTDLRNVPSIAYPEKGKVIYTGCKREFDISKQAVGFKKIDIDKYRVLSHFYDNFNDIFMAPILPYSFSRGCSFRCTICGEAKRDLSYKKPEQIINDLKEMKKRYGYRYFYFLNRHLTITKKFIEELCDNIIDSKLDILWSDSIKPMSYLSQNTYYKLREAGCIQLTFGVETGSERIMKLMNKGHSVSDSEKNLKFSHKAGIWNIVNLVVGFPTETDKEFNETLDFVRRNYDYVDSPCVSTFILVNNYIKAHPEKFGIKIKSEEKLKRLGDPVVISCEYEEINGLPYEKMLKVHQDRQKQIHKLFSKTDNYRLNLYSHTLVFSLYDHLTYKNKVRAFFKENYDIIERVNNSFCSLFTGVSSNQQIKGNLTQCEDKSLKIIAKEKLINRVNDIYQKGFKKLIIVGGEPLIHPDIFEILHHARNIGFKYIIIKTNARMLKYEDFCRKISNLIDEILVINHSENKDEYESVSGVKESFFQMQKGIENWKKLNKKMRYYSKQAH